MEKNKFGEIILHEQDLVDHVMQHGDLASLSEPLVDPTVDLETAALILNDVPRFIEYDAVAAHVVALCKTEAELQRVGQELLLYQERDLFNLLRYLKYLVDTLRHNRCIWGVGRGSSVASHVLYLLGVHRVDSLYYDLDPHEFLRK